MPATQSDYSSIEEARRRAGALGERALSLQAGAETFSDRVMKDVRSARAERGTSLLAQDIGTTTGQLVTGGPEMRGRMAEVSPLQTDIMTARERAGTMGTLATQATAQEGITGTIQDVIGGGVNQLKSAALLKQAEADKATSEANTLLEQVQLKEAQINREFEEWATRQQVAQGWAQVNKPAGGGLTAYQQWQMQKWLMGQQQEQGEVNNEINYKVGMIDDAIKALESGKVKVGPLAGRFIGVTSMFDKGTADFYRNVQQIATEEMFEIGGKVLPVQEINRLKPYLPVDMTKTKQQILGDLEQLKKGLQVNYGTFGAALAPMGETTGFEGLFPATQGTGMESSLEGLYQQFGGQ